MADFPDGSNYQEPKQHPLTDLWRDIPESGEFVRANVIAREIAAQGGSPLPTTKKRWWRRTSRGAITLPATASRLAEHAELVGYVYDPSRAKIKYIDPVRGGKSLTSPGDWVDIDAPAPPQSPQKQLAAVAFATLTPQELMALRDDVDQQIQEIQP